MFSGLFSFRESSGNEHDAINSSSDAQTVFVHPYRKLALGNATRYFRLYVQVIQRVFIYVKRMLCLKESEKSFIYIFFDVSAINRSLLTLTEG